MISHRYKFWLLLGAVLGGLAVALGSFGAHGLEIHLGKTLSAKASVSAAERKDQAERKLDVWETAVRYQMYHALALLAVGWLASRRCGLAIHLAGAALTAGTLVFSGCLYGYVLSDLRWLALSVPIGGVLFIIGWICLAVAVASDAGVPVER
jgi:uncharacterized membrane protein YgdD (TMEM256/DUF423 family)